MKKRVLYFLLVPVVALSSCGSGGVVDKDSLCGKKFVSDVGVTEGELAGERSTILKCDGTFESSSSNLNLASLNGDSPEYEVNTNENEFTGTWEVVENVSEELKEEVRKYGLNHSDYTLIKYKSSNGISGYCLYYKVNSDYSLSPLYMNQVPQSEYKNSGSLGIWEGFQE